MAGIDAEKIAKEAINAGHSAEPYQRRKKSILC